MPPAANANADHDLLVRLDTKLDLISISFNEMKVSISLKADAARVSQIEERVTSAERKLYLMAGGIAVLQFLLRWLPIIKP